MLLGPQNKLWFCLESVEMVRLVSHERVQQRTAHMPGPQMAEETVKMVGLAPREKSARVSFRPTAQFG